VLNVRTSLFAGAALVGVIGAIFFLSEPPPSTLPTVISDEKPRTPAPKVSTPVVDMAGAEHPSRVASEASVAKVDEATGNDTAFRTDAAGQLVLDEQTRLNIEALIAQADSQNLHAAVREQTESLPAAAAKQAEELVDKFVYYQQAQRQTYPPDNAPLTEDDAVRELEGLHALRETHLGPEVARQLFGDEEAIAREMIEVMRVENDQSLTAQERIERGKALREQLPGVAAIESNNRKTEAARTGQQEK
jgi:Proteobacterial lipase chaperone protein